MSAYRHPVTGHREGCHCSGCDEVATRSPNDNMPPQEYPPTLRMKCPECGRVVDMYRDLDGYGRLRTDGPLRYSHHAGNRWGRPCRMNGEQFLGDEP